MKKLIVGRLPKNFGDYVPGSYGKMNRVLIFNSEVESKYDNNTTVPAYYDEESDTVVFNTEYWKVISDGTAAWLLSRDKAYNPTVFSGLGRVVLKKNMQDVVINGESVRINLLTQDMFCKDQEVGGVTTRVPNTHTVFVVEYDFALNAFIRKEITIDGSDEVFIGETSDITIDTSNSILKGQTYDVLISADNSTVIDGVTYYYTAYSLENGKTIRLFDTTNCVLLDELTHLAGTDTITAVGDNVIYIASTVADTYTNAYKVGTIYYYKGVSLAEGKKLILNDTTHCVLLDANLDVTEDTEVIASADMTVNIASAALGTYTDAYSIGNDYYYQGVNLDENYRFDLLDTENCVLLNSDHTEVVDDTYIIADEAQMVYVASLVAGTYNNAYMISGQDSITIPEASILKFEGGSISNGSIIWNETMVTNLYGTQILSGITESATRRTLGGEI